jgi:hypothetical protein
MEWVAVLFTLPRNVVYPALLPLMRTSRLPAVERIDAPAELKGLVRFAERRNLGFARAPSHFKRILLQILSSYFSCARSIAKFATTVGKSDKAV